MENLLDKHGWKFEADFCDKHSPTSGVILVEDGVVWVEGSLINAFKESQPFKWVAEEGTPDQIKKLGFINFRLLEPESKEPTVSKEEGERHDVITRRLSPYQVARHIEEINVKDPPKSESDKQTIRRETATQLLAGMQGNPHVFEEWTADQQADKAIELTDLLLKKLGE